MRIGHFTIGFALALLAATQPAHSDCISPAGPAGQVVYNEDVNALQYCNGADWIAMGAINPSAGSGTCANPAAPERTMIYNNDYSVMQFCNGQDWIAIGPYPVPTGTLIGPSGCPNIGDLCADGTVFAGYHQITHEHMFIPTTDQGTTSVWKTSAGTNDITTDSAYDGRVNTNQVPNSATFPAFKVCKDLTVGGHNDWYLPSRAELDYLYSQRGQLVSSGNITDFQNGDYWSSTESNAGNAWQTDLTNGGIFAAPKTVDMYIRCVRR